MSFIVETILKEIEVDHVINGLIVPDDTIVFDAALINGDTVIIAISRGNKGYQEALSQIREINKKLKEINIKKEKAAPVLKPEYKWGAWESENLLFIDPFSGCNIPLVCKIRTNGKRVEIKVGTLKSSASCNIKKGDKFDYEFGKNLAKRRLIAKLVELRANDMDLKK